MKEIEYIKIIKETINDSSYIGDDCAFLDAKLLGDKGLFVTQDSLVEDIHFNLSTISPCQLGEKAINVNLSDLAAACAEPVFVTISLSLPHYLDIDFVKQFYLGVNSACEKYGIKIAGGDLTGSDKLFISICAAGKKMIPYSVSRRNAKDKDVVVTTGFHGDSAGGLRLILNNISKPQSLVNAHLSVQPQIEKSMLIANAAENDFAMMDTSDGLADALFKFSQESNVNINVDFESIPISRELKETFSGDYKNLVLWGGEDYQLLFCLSENVYEKLDKNKFFKIGNVVQTDSNPCVKIKDNNQNYVIDKDMFSKKSFNHFGEK